MASQYFENTWETWRDGMISPAFTGGFAAATVAPELPVATSINVCRDYANEWLNIQKAAFELEWEMANPRLALNYREIEAGK